MINGLLSGALPKYFDISTTALGIRNAVMWGDREAKRFVDCPLCELLAQVFARICIRTTFFKATREIALASFPDRGNSD